MAQIGTEGINLIKEFEGVRLACYHLGDGVCTIGYGHTRPLSQCPGAGSWVISQAQAEQMLVADVQGYCNAVTSYFTRSFNQNQLDALISFAYNLGGGIFAQYAWDRKATDDYILASIPKYNMPGTQFTQGLTRRRNAECALYRKPVSGGSKPAPAPAPKPGVVHPGLFGRPIEQVASEVQQGKFGGGDARKANLGWYYEGAQAIVNERAKVISGDQCHQILAKEVLAGHLGAGEQRKKILGNYYNVVQAIINKGAAPAAQYYVIASGDTLSGIAAKFGTSVAQLQNWNGIANANAIQAGARIRVK
jgi:Phage-related lysozyme (muraminidase)